MCNCFPTLIHIVTHWIGYIPYCYTHRIGGSMHGNCFSWYHLCRLSSKCAALENITLVFCFTCIITLLKLNLQLPDNFSPWHVILLSLVTYFPLDCYADFACVPEGWICMLNSSRTSVGHLRLCIIPN